MLRKLISLVVVLCFVLVLPLQAITAPKTTPKPTPVPKITDWKGETLTFANEGGSSWSAPTEDREKAWRDSLEKKYNFKFNYTTTGSQVSAEKFIVTAMAGSPFADAVSMMSDNIAQLINKKLCYPLDTLKQFDFSAKNASLDKYVTELTTKYGHIYGFASPDISNNKFFLVYNTSMAKKLGIPDIYTMWKNKTWTWKKLLDYSALATKDTNKDGKKDTYGIIGYVDFLALQYVCSTGTMLIDNNDKVHYNSPNVIKAMTEFKKMNPFFMPTPNGVNWDWSYTQFATGNVLFVNEAATYVMNNWLGKMKDSWSAIPFPAPAAGGTYYAMSNAKSATLVPYNDPHPELVAFWEKLAYGHRPWDYDKKGKLLPALTPREKETKNIQRYAKDQATIDVVLNQAFDAPFIFDRSRQYKAYWENPGFYTFAFNIWNGTQTPAQAAQAFQGPVQNKIDNF